MNHMSVKNQLVLEQHLYSSDSIRGFSTIACTDGINKAERIAVENASIYRLPAPLLYEEGIKTPNKYVYYTLEGDRIVIGRGVQAGRDALGRPGNYIFHNLITSVSHDSWFNTPFNPAKLIKAAEAADVFLDAVPTITELKQIVLPERQMESQEPGKREMVDERLALQILYSCTRINLKEQPILLQGSEADQLDFLEWLFDVLPFSIRLKLSFNTYSFGAYSGYDVLGLPNETEYRQPMDAVFVINLPECTLTGGPVAAGVPPDLAFIMEAARESRCSDLNSYYKLQYALQTRDFAYFINDFTPASSSVKKQILANNKVELLQYTATSGDMEFIHKVIKNLKPEDIDILAVRPEILQKVIDSASGQQLAIITRWFQQQDPREDIYRLLFNSDELWRRFLAGLQHVVSLRDTLLLLVDMLRANYRPEFEKSLISALLVRIEAIRTYRNLPLRLAQSLSRLPTDDRRLSSGHMYIRRLYTIYILTGDSDFLDMLVTCDLSALPESLYVSVVRAIIAGSYSTYRDKDILVLLEQLFHTGNKPKLFLRELLNVKAPRHLRADVQMLFHDLIAELPPDEETESLRWAASGVFQHRRSLRR